MTTTSRPSWAQDCYDCGRSIPGGMSRQYVDDFGLRVRHVNGCPPGRHSTGIHVVNLGAVVDRRGDFPGRHRHRAIREHSFVQRRGDDKHGCGRPEEDDPDVICGYYREHHPTMLSLA